MSDYNTDLAPGLSPGLGEAPKLAPVAPSNTELETSLFHTQNSLGSVIQRMSRGSYTPQAGYNPVDDLKSWESDEYLRNHGSAFLGSQSPQETQAIKAEIDQGIKERQAIAASGWNGTVAGLRMGLVDPTMFLPMGNAVRLARAATVGGRAADVGLSVGKVALMQSTAQEALLQASQPERTLSESAINVGSSTLLASLIGAGGYALLAREGLLDKGLGALDQARVKLSRHNGVIEPEATKSENAAVMSTGPSGTIADGIPAFRPAKPSFPDHEYNVDGYHGTNDVIAQFDAKQTRLNRGVFFSDTPDLANKFAHGLATDSDAAHFPDEPGFLDWIKPHISDKEFTTIAETHAKHDAAMAEMNKHEPDSPGYLKAQDEYTILSRNLNEEARKVSAYIDHDTGDFTKAPNVTPVRLRLGKTHEVDMGGKFDWDVERDAINYAEENGYDSVTLKNFGEGADRKIYSILDAQNIRHRFEVPQTTAPAGTGMALAAGAAPSDTRNLSPVPYGLDSIPGVGKAVSKMFPNLDVLTNAVHPAKAALSEMVDTPIALMANKEGQTATRYGGPTIERELKQVREGLHWQADQEMMKQWGAYLDQGEGGATFMQRQTGQAPAGKMSFDDFNAAVYDALSTGDAHPTPQVAAMAQWIRKNGLDPIKERALKSIDGFNETTTRPGETYAPRNWDKEKISANWNDYVGTWTDHLEAEQRTKAQAQERLGVFQGALESHRATIDKYEGRIGKLSEDSDVIAARQEETTRLNKAANRRAETLRTRDQDTLPLKNAQGGAVFETLARNRGNLLADRASAKLSEIESLQQKLAAEIEKHDTMREKIETEIAAWDGKSATEAKSALKARAEAEKGREVQKQAGTYKGKDERLSSADKAIDSAVKDILNSERALDRQELKDRAEEIASRVIGTPEGRLPYDASSTSGAVGPGTPELRGHAAHREIDIPYEMAKPWLRRSATEALKSYTHSVLPDALLAERFDGDPSLTAVMKEIESAYAAKRAEAKSETAQTRLKSQMDADIKNVAAMRDRIRGTFGYDPTMQGLARFSQNALKVNNIISSHGMAVASLPDFAGVVFRHGIESAFKDAWVPFAASLMDNEAWQAVKAAGDEWKAFGIGIEMHSASRNHALSDIAEHYRPNSKFERALTWASDKAFIANLLAPLTDIQKRMATNAVASNILRMSEAVAGGKATAKQIQRLAEGNITEAQAARIWDQWSNNGGERVKGIILPNMDKWTDQGAALAFRGAVGRDVDIAVVQPGYGEIPKFMSKQGFNVLTQYKKFTMSATQRILISNLQRHDAGTMAGLVTAVGMGMLAYRINTMASGQKMATDMPTLFKEGVSRGGVLGVIDDSNSIVSKATGGKVDLYRLAGADKPLSKYVSRDAASMFLGPTYGKMVNLMQVARGAAHPSEWNEGDSHALRMMTLGTNFPYLPQLFDKVEQGANHAFGIPMKAKPQ